MTPVVTISEANGRTWKRRREGNDSIRIKLQ